MTPEWQATNLASQFAVASLTNEFLTNASVGFQTDWVFSMPTRRYAVAVNYSGDKAVFNPGVNTHFTPANVTMDAQGRACVDSGNMQAFDREENTRKNFVISPASVYRFCGETSVLAFNKTPAQASLLGAQIARENVEAKYADGWFTMTGLGIGAGLPVIGFAAVKANGNIGGTWAHRFERP